MDFPSLGSTSLQKAFTHPPGCQIDSIQNVEKLKDFSIKPEAIYLFRAHFMHSAFAGNGDIAIKNIVAIINEIIAMYKTK